MFQQDSIVENEQSSPRRKHMGQPAIQLTNSFPLAPAGKGISSAGKTTKELWYSRRTACRAARQGSCIQANNTQSYGALKTKCPKGNGGKG